MIIEECLRWLSLLSVQLDFGSGPNLSLHEIEPNIGLCADGAEPAGDSPSLSAHPPLAHSLSLR